MFAPIDLDATRIALVQFGAQVHNEHLFNDEQTYDAVVDRIHNIEHLKGLFRFWQVYEFGIELGSVLDSSLALSKYLECNKTNA